MRNWPAGRGMDRWRPLEASAAGLAYGAGLCWVSVCLLASFRPGDLSTPYWRGVPGLRSDTSGILAFIALAVCFTGSEYLRLRRRKGAVARDVAAAGIQVASGAVARPLALAVAETVTVLSTGLALYLSVNAVTHPVTLQIRATHLAAWPTEGTLRVLALLLSVCSVTVLRYLWPGSPAGRVD